MRNDLFGWALGPMFVLLVACSNSKPTLQLGPLVGDPPSSWERLEPTGDSLSAEFKLGAIMLDSEDAILSCYLYGEEGLTSGSRLDEWCTHFVKADELFGARGVRKAFQVNGLDVYTVHIQGVLGYGDWGRDRTEWGLFGAVLDGPGVTVGIKLVGPERTVKAKKESVIRFIRTLERVRE